MGIMNRLSSMFGKGGSASQSAEASAPGSPVDKSVLVEKIRQSDLFKDLPPANMEELFARMETVRMKAGETVIREGDEGDYYYLLVSGIARVTRRPPKGGDAQVVAELKEPKGFGEEALISNAKRNATVTMVADGVLMRLSKDTFSTHIKEPLLTWLSPLEAQDRIAKGAKWVDVRDPLQAKHTRLHGAISIPMEEIRSRMAELDRNTFYVCYCQNGRLSSTAAFLLRQNSLNVGVLRGGLQGLQRAGLA